MIYLKKNITIIKKRLLFYIFNIFLVLFIVLNYLNKNLMPLVIEYGKKQCDNISTRLINYVVASQLSDDLKEEIVIYNEGEITSIDFNTSILNSISSTAIKKIQSYFYLLDHGKMNNQIIEMLGINVNSDSIKKGIIYEVPMFAVFGNSLIGNLGFKVPVRYSLIGQINGKIISKIVEYGINNAFIEINLEIVSNAMVAVPFVNETKSVVVSIPLVMKSIQGNIPTYLLGTNILSEVNG